MSTDQHLIAEIKRELDWAAEEVKRTEAQMKRLEREFATSMKGVDEEERRRLYDEKIHLQARVGLHDAYCLQRRAASRFATLCYAFEIASMTKSSEEIRQQLSQFMYRAIDGEPENADQKDKLLELAEALKTYFSEGYCDEADEAIREAWQNIEETIRELGRKVQVLGIMQKKKPAKMTGFLVCQKLSLASRRSDSGQARKSIDLKKSIGDFNLQIDEIGGIDVYYSN